MRALHENEKLHENKTELHGKELCNEDGNINDNKLVELIDVFERNVGNVSDERRREHLIQAKVVYETFKNVLPEKLRNRYQEVLRSLEKRYFFH